MVGNGTEQKEIRVLVFTELSFQWGKTGNENMSIKLKYMLCQMLGNVTEKNKVGLEVGEVRWGF